MGGHWNDGRGTQNQGNHIGDRSCVRQSKLYRRYGRGAPHSCRAKRVAIRADYGCVLSRDRAGMRAAMLLRSCSGQGT
jgi:hypothetical protein